ncbi:hypothetical protein MTP99_019195 [Tenebrio molitor]|nr:hypothetical protein MTP99_019195 [Tenebrio molitor]
MTLSYWWMHWFWITFRIYFIISEEISLSTHSISPVTNSSTDSVRGVKTVGISNFNPPNYNNPSNSSILNTSMTKYQKPSSKKLDFKYSNMTKQDTTKKDDEMSGNLTAAGITGITLGCVVIVGVICGVSYFLYRNRGFNRPQVLNDRCSNPDSSGYIDDASVRDNSEEMYSLDNDSFLNSLEAMTIQNYWTDTVKHTKL